MTPEMKRELQHRLAENPLEDYDDLMEYVQYASRLAALGEEEAFRKLPEIFATTAFHGKIAPFLRLRCEQGLWEAEEYTGEDLAFALIDAQDFFCFQQKMNGSFAESAELAPFFANWWDACEGAELDEEAASLLRDFLNAYPIPEELRLPVINTPITETQYELLETLYADIEPPVIEMQWSHSSTVRPGVPAKKSPEFSDVMSLLACDDTTPSESLKKLLESLQNQVETPHGVLHIGRRLMNTWVMQIFVLDSNGAPFPADRVRLGAVPAIRGNGASKSWSVSLDRFSPEKRGQLLKEPVTILLPDGLTVKCTSDFN